MDPKVSLDASLLSELSAQATVNPRLRQNYDLRTSLSDGSQRMLNALEPGTVLPIHRHRNTSETVVILKGSLVETFYDNQGHPTASYTLKPDSPCVGLNIPAGQWHNLVCLEPGTVLFEAKDGPWTPLDPSDVL